MVSHLRPKVLKKLKSQFEKKRIPIRGGLMNRPKYRAMNEVEAQNDQWKLISIGKDHYRYRYRDGNIAIF